MKPEIENAVNKIVEWAKEKKAENILMIDVREKTDYTDSIIICDGMNEIHLKAIADHIKDESKKYGLSLLAIEGYDYASWILLDFVDIIVHIFNKETRKYYKLEELWNITSKNKTDLEQNND